MLKRTQKEASEESQNWYQDKYQHVLTQRNVLAVISLAALVIAMLAVFTVLRLAPLKSVDPYLLEIDEKTGITRKVNPVTRNEYAANKAVNDYFTATYLRTRETYNPSIILYNYNIVRLMSTPSVFAEYRRQLDPSVEGSLAKELGASGKRDVRIRFMNDLPVALPPGSKPGDLPPYSIIQAHITTIDTKPNQPENVTNWVVTMTFVYANLAINEAEQLLNPLGYQVINYQIQREII